MSDDDNDDDKLGMALRNFAVQTLRDRLLSQEILQTMETRRDLSEAKHHSLDVLYKWALRYEQESADIYETWMKWRAFNPDPNAETKA